MRKVVGLTAALLFGSYIWPTDLHATDTSCLEYEPAVVTLTGTITTHLEYGSPNFGENPKTDEKLWYWYLDLDKPICVNAKDDSWSEAETGMRRLQIVYVDGYPHGGRRQWIGHRATITGTLFHSDNGHHITKVLIKATRTSAIRSGTSFLP